MKTLFCALGAALLLPFAAEARKPSKPAAPSGLVATASTQVGYATVNLAWIDNANNEQGTRIERALMSSGPWTQIGTVGANIKAYGDFNLAFSTTYFYRVRAYNSFGVSAYSGISSGTTAPSSSGTATNVTALANNVAVTGTISGSAVQSSWRYYYLDVPGSVSKLAVNLSNLTGDVDLYLKFASLPTLTSFNCLSKSFGPTPESCIIASPTAGRWYFGVNNGAIGTFDFTIVGNYTLASSTNCTYVTVPGYVEIGTNGGATNLTVTAPAGCIWPIVNYNPDWISITNTGSGTDTVTMTVATNIFGNSRLGGIKIAERLLWVQQEGTGCILNLLPTNAVISSFSTTNAFSVLGVLASTCPWTATNTVSWLSLQSAVSGVTPAQIVAVAFQNDTGLWRTGQVTVSDKTFTVRQAPFDTNAPTVPVGIQPFTLSSTALFLKWTPATDAGSGVARYRIYRGGTLIDATENPYYTDVALPEGAQTCYRISAVDVAGNESALSTNTCASTLTAANRILPFEFPESPPSFLEYDGHQSSLGIVQLACLNLAFSNATTLPQLPASYYQEAWLTHKSNYSSAGYLIDQQSYGQVKLRGDFISLILPIEPTCNGYDVMAAAQNAAVASGLDLNRFDWMVADIASPQLCDFAGQSLHQIFGIAGTADAQHFWATPNWMFNEQEALGMNGRLTLFDPQLVLNNGGSVSQESGWLHVFGHWHVFGEAYSVYGGTNVALSANNTNNLVGRYNNGYDPMGVLVGHFAGRLKEALGYLKPTPITTSGTYTLHAYEQAESATKVLSLPAGDMINKYYLEYRPQGALGGSNGKGVTLYYVTPHVDYMSPFLVLTTPPTTTNVIDYATNSNNPQLMLNTPFVDPWIAGAYTLTVTATNTTAATVVIAGLPAGDVTPPTLAITSPANGSTINGAVPIHFTAIDNKVLWGFQVFEDGALIKNLFPPDCENPVQGNHVSSPCSTNITTWFYYQPRSLGSHVITITAWDSRNSTSAAITLLAGADTAPTKTVFLTPLPGATVTNNQQIVIGYSGTPDSDVALMQLFVDNQLSAFTHCNFLTPQNSHFDLLNLYGCWQGWTTGASDGQGGTRAVNCLNSNVTFDGASGVLAPPHRLLWASQNETPGTHVLTLKVFDFAGNVLTRTLAVEVGDPSECFFSISPISAAYPNTQSFGNISVAATQPFCAWTSSSDSGWLRVFSNPGGSGSLVATYVVDANPTMALRTGIITIAGKTFTVIQNP